MSVREAQQRIDSAEFSGWLAFARHEPIGLDRLDLLAGLVCSVLDGGFMLAARAAGAKFHGAKATSAADFVPRWWDAEIKRQSVDEQKNVFDMFFHAMKQAA